MSFIKCLLCVTEENNSKNTINKPSESCHLKSVFYFFLCILLLKEHMNFLLDYHQTAKLINFNILSVLTIH